MIVLLKPDPAWEQLLGQAGFPYRTGSPDVETRVLVAPGRTGTRELAAALGACTPGCGLLADRDSPAAHIPGNGPVEVLPFRVVEVTRPGRAAVRAFPSDAPRPVVERVAARDRGEARRAMTTAVRRLLEAQSLPCVRLAACPAGAPSVLGFRVDTDYCGRAEMEATRRLADRVGMSFSWFFNTEAHGRLLGELDRLLEGQDVQVHCYQHEVFSTARQNRENIGRALIILREHGHQPVGVASPYGDWNPAWDEALAELGLDHASDFVAGYDDLPFRPPVRSRLSPVLQVPVHPVCFGRLRAARASNDNIVKYFGDVVARKVSLREPCLLYDHPSAVAGNEELLADILCHARQTCGAVTTLTAYAEWWRRREQVLVANVVANQHAVELNIERGDELVELELESRGRWVRLPLKSGRYMLDGLDWGAAEASEPGPRTRVPLRSRLSEQLRRLKRQKRTREDNKQ